jgi:predicted ATP-dependent endonuclease of OLD family
MYIQKIHIKNYRNFNDFEMEFHEGLNVIVGANNSGKTGLLSAIYLLNSPSNISIDDFNKNNLVQFKTLYNEDAPKTEITYFINHFINEDDDEDESIIKLIPFLGFKEVDAMRLASEDKKKYFIKAIVKAVYELDEKYIGEYRKAVSGIDSFDDFMLMFKRYVAEHYKWHYTNGVSDLSAESKAATSIFDIRFIEAERTAAEVEKETRKEIDSFSKDNSNAIAIDKFKSKVSEDLRDILKPSIEKLAILFETEQNDIGLQKGNVAIYPSVKANVSIPDSFITEVKDTKSEFIVPIDHNGLGYNNLINIYMLIKLKELQVGKDFRILCLEEPEAHLHPAMQYKLFKYLKMLDAEKKLNQQIFVTTHSSNISAVAGIDNMFMMAYNRSVTPQDCINQSLELQFKDEGEKKQKSEAKKHLAKFLDVTRSDMLFADKVVLVEGIAERLLLPYFMEKCGYAYEDEHVSIVEIGGKHFEHFVELFNGNALKKKVLCITDKDFNWINEDRKFNTLESYLKDKPTHIEKLQERFTFDEFKIITQDCGGRTFEDELFLANCENIHTATELLKMALPESLQTIINSCKLDATKWEGQLSSIDGRSKHVIESYINSFNNSVQKKNKFYKNLLFAEIFLHYAKNKKGDMALSILTEAESLSLNVPSYIKEGIEWLK